jgi:hypothetical protein
MHNGTLSILRVHGAARQKRERGDVSEGRQEGHHCAQRHMDWAKEQGDITNRSIVDKHTMMSSDRCLLLELVYNGWELVLTRSCKSPGGCVRADLTNYHLRYHCFACFPPRDGLNRQRDGVNFRAMIIRTMSLATYRMPWSSWRASSKSLPSVRAGVQK